MEREPPEVARRLMQACRSLNYNRELRPLVEERIERAEGRLRDYLLARGLTTLRLGAFQVDMDEEGTVDIERVQLDGNWRQIPLSERSSEGQPDVVSGDSDGEETLVRGVPPREQQAQGPNGESGNTIYERARQTQSGGE